VGVRRLAPRDRRPAGSRTRDPRKEVIYVTARARQLITPGDGRSRTPERRCTSPDRPANPATRISGARGPLELICSFSRPAGRAGGSYEVSAVIALRGTYVPLTSR